MPDVKVVKSPNTNKSKAKTKSEMLSDEEY